MGVVSRYMEDSFGKWHVQCTNKDTTLYIVDSCHELSFISYVHCTSLSDISSKNSQQDLDKNLAWISARSCMISQEFGTPCYILLHLDKILSRFLWDFASCKILQDFGTCPTKSCNILLRSCEVFLQGIIHSQFAQTGSDM